MEQQRALGREKVAMDRPLFNYWHESRKGKKVLDDMKEDELDDLHARCFRGKAGLGR